MEVLFISNFYEHFLFKILLNSYKFLLKIVIDSIKICRSECESFFSECGSILNTTDASSFLPDCSAYSSTNCSHFDFIPPLGLLESSPFL